MKAFAVALCLCPCIAVAQVKPLPADPVADGHSFATAYDNDKPIPLKIQYGMQCVVEISPAEKLLYAVIPPGSPVESIKAQSQGIDVPLLNFLPLVGAVPGGPVGITIISQDVATEHQHAYPLLVTVVKPPGDGKVAPDVCMKMKFTYTAAQIAATSPGAPKPSWQEQQAKKKMDIAKARLNEDPWYGPQNDNYWVTGKDKDIIPIYAPHDNGVVTLFPFAGPAPTVLLVESSGMPNACKGLKPSKEELRAPEETLNQTAYLDKTLVHATGWHFRLRKNYPGVNGQAYSKVAEIWNCGFKNVPDTGTGTGSDDVVRKVITQR